MFEKTAKFGGTLGNGESEKRLFTNKTPVNDSLDDIDPQPKLESTSSFGLEATLQHIGVMSTKLDNEN